MIACVRQSISEVLKKKRGQDVGREVPVWWISTKIDQFDSSLGRQENVVAFDVTVDDPVVVQMLETLLSQQRRHGAWGEGQRTEWKRGDTFK